MTRQSSPFPERPSAALQTIKVPAHIQRCGGNRCPPGTCDHDESGKVQRFGDREHGPAQIPSSVTKVLRRPGQALDTSTLAEMEGRFGHDFGQVRVHTDAEAAESAHAIRAHAYTVGQHVVMGEGRYQPNTGSGRRLLAHELVHTMQQPANPTTENWTVSSPSDGAEIEAETLAANALVTDSIAKRAPPAGTFPERRTFQRQFDAQGIDRMVPRMHPPVTAVPVAGTVQRMLACPPRLADREPPPPGWQSYHGDPAFFHCGFRGILEGRTPTPEDPQNECFYDHSGMLVDESHPYAGCRGTPNQYDSASSPISHTLIDSGGIVRAGLPAFVTSRVHDVSTAIATVIEVVSGTAMVIRSIAQGFGDLVTLSILTGAATVEPGNWTFLGLPARSVRHLNVMGFLLGSTDLAGSVDSLLRNLTRRLDSFPITGLLDDLTADLNQAQGTAGPQPSRVVAGDLGALNMVQLVEFLRTQARLAYVRPPEDLARERLAGRPSAGNTPTPAPSQ